MPGNRSARAIRRYRIWCRAAILLLSGLYALAPAATVFAQTLPAADERAGHIAEASQRFRIPENWIRAVLNAESAQNMRAVSDAGAMGLMQIMPGTWGALRVRYELGDDPFDPRDNILAGTAYLREMLDRYGSVRAMLAAYNAGPGRYDQYLTAARALPIETRVYVAKLAPLLGGEPLPDELLTATSLPPDWREAPLFSAPTASSVSAYAPHANGRANIKDTAVPARADDAATTPPQDIFVVLPATEFAP